LGRSANLGEPVNSTADDFCPTPVGKHGLFFVSREALPGACGQGDIYFTQRIGAAGWAERQHLLCAPAGRNSELDEQGPSWVDVSKGKLRGKKLLYFSRNSDLYRPIEDSHLSDYLGLVEQGFASARGGVGAKSEPQGVLGRFAAECV